MRTKPEHQVGICRTMQSAIACSVVVALTAIGLSACARADSASPVPSEPVFPGASPGPYPVGYAVVTVPATGSRPSLTVHVWYPSRPSSRSKASYQIIPGVNVPAHFAVDGAEQLSGRFPLVVYSHGSGAFGVVATYFTEVLASNGYVVAAPDHPGDTIIDAALRIDNTNYQSNVANRIDDLSRVITALTVPTDVTASAVSRMIEPGKIVVTGHSLGGVAAVGLAASDPRVDMVIAMDPTSETLTPQQLAQVKVPVLMFWSADGVDESEPQVYDTMPGPWYQVTLPSAHHDGFTDLCSYEKLLPTWIPVIQKADPGLDIQTGLAAFDFPLNCDPPTLSPVRFHDLVDGYSLSFLEYSLLGNQGWKSTFESSRADASFAKSGANSGSTSKG